MKIKLLLISLIGMFVLVACSEQTYEVEEMVATLDGEDIKVRDIILQYPLTDENVEIYLKQEIIIHEAKKMGESVSKQSIEELKMAVYPNAEIVEMLDFNTKEAKALGMTNEEYFDRWALLQLERTHYFQAYIESEFGEPSSDREVEKWGKEIEDSINTLYRTYIENGRLTIY